MNVFGLHFASPVAFVLFAVVAALGAFIAWRSKKHRNPTFTFSSIRLADDVPATIWSRLAWLPDALRIGAMALFIIALARPQVVGAAQDEEAEGIDIVLALDTSCSMQAADFQPDDRMHVAKASITQFIQSRTVDRIGLVVFAAEAATWVPLTLDYPLLVDLLDEVEIGLLPDGTAIGSAIGTALNRLKDSSAASRVVVLVTDGDNNSGNISPKKAAEFAKELGVQVYTILIGRGGPVPFPSGKDIFGRTVFREQVVPTNPELLAEIAKISGGEAYRAKDGEELDARLVDVLDALKRSRLDSGISAPPKDEHFGEFAVAGLIFVLIELVLSATRLRRFP